MRGCLIGLLLSALPATAGVGSTIPDDPLEVRMQALLQGVPLVDGHNDLMIHFHGCRDGCPRGLDGYAIRDVAGIDHVGIGGDFDGIDYSVRGLEDVSAYPRLFAELSRRGWSDADLRKLAGGNFLRVLDAADAAAALSRSGSGPPPAPRS